MSHVPYPWERPGTHFIYIFKTAHKGASGEICWTLRECALGEIDVSKNPDMRYIVASAG
jgi:hypothetical protein